jgi:hypothetical protein
VGIRKEVGTGLLAFNDDRAGTLAAGKGEVGGRKGKCAGPRGPGEGVEVPRGIHPMSGDRAADLGAGGHTAALGEERDGLTAEERVSGSFHFAGGTCLEKRRLCGRLGQRKCPEVQGLCGD